MRRRKYLPGVIHWRLGCVKGGMHVRSSHHPAVLFWSSRAAVTVPETSPVAPEIFAGLIGRVAGQRDRAAFARLFDHFAPRVKSYMLRLGASAAQAEDLAQDTLLTLWHKADRFDPARAGAVTWVFTIARNLRIDTLRRERLVEPLDELAAAAIAADDMPADSAIAVGQAEAALRRAMAGLSEEEATLVRLSFFEDSAHGAIGRTLGMPLGTVKSKLRRTIGRLRAAMEDRG